MNKVVSVPSASDLEAFLDFMYEGLEGYAYLVAKEPNDPESWDQAFFEWPAQRNHMVRAIESFSPTQEIYIAPAIFKNKNSTKESVKATNVIWTEFDGNTPDSFDIPPSLIVRSSEPGHEHCYWKLDSPLTSIEEIEDYNRRICYKYHADKSAWDANQVLRPPYTTNHKRGGLPVATISLDQTTVFNTAVFDDLAPAPEKTVDYGLWEKLDLPSLNDVIYRNRFGPDFKGIFEKDKSEVTDRSTTLTNMAFICAEAGLTDREIYVIIAHLAERWEKFKHHTASNRAKQLISIIEHTRVKYPSSQFGDYDEVIEYSPKSLLETDIKVEWAIPGMVMKGGVLVFAGPSGVGKTQFSMQVMFHAAMGKDFLHYKFDKPLKIGFISGEMGDVEIKHFLQEQYPELVDTCTAEQIALLNQNMKIIPFGENVPLNTAQGQDILVTYLEANEWDGVFIDSIGTSILGNINDMSTVQPWTNFNDKIRKRYGLFLWYIHHFRKPPPGTKSYGGQEELYGDQYITGRATSVYTLTRAKNENLKVRNPKQRHAPEEKDYLIRRTDKGLMFTYQGEAEAPPPNIIEQITNQTSAKDLPDDPMPFKKG